MRGGGERRDGGAEADWLIARCVEGNAGRLECVEGAAVVLKREVGIRAVCLRVGGGGSRVDEERRWLTDAARATRKST